MVTGAGIFGAITLLGGIIAGKEAMGLGDVKFMGAVRFILWCKRNCASFAVSVFCGSHCFGFCFVNQSFDFEKQR